jgi:hypothetical protein
MMLFHSPQAAHFPDQREVTAPQAWQTKALEALAMIPTVSPGLDSIQTQSSCPAEVPGIHEFPAEARRGWPGQARP